MTPNRERPTFPKEKDHPGGVQTVPTLFKAAGPKHSFCRFPNFEAVRTRHFEIASKSRRPEHGARGGASRDAHRMELDLLSDLNNLLSSANEAADAPWQPPLSKRQQQAAGVSSSSDEEEDLPGPGAYDVKVVATGKRVVGGKWGSAPRSDVSAKRKSSRGEDVVPGPGAYEPNR